MKVTNFFTSLLAFSLATSCEKKSEAPQPQSAKVEVAQAVTKRVPYLVRTIGNTSAFSTVDIRPQVSGELTGFYFVDGQFIEEGDLLFTIDSRPYAAALEQAVGQFEQAQASYAYNTQRVERYQGLLPEDFVSKLNFEEYVSARDISLGQMTEFQGSIKEAEVNLGFCTILAPLSGICNRHPYDPGNIVSTEQERPLLTIKQIEPIYALLTVAEQDFPSVHRYQKESKEGLAVDIHIVGESKTYRGKLDFIDNTVDPSTGTILLRAIFPNEEREIWPGQFVHADITLYEIPEAVLVPETAVQRDTKGTFLYVAKEDGTVEQRRIDLGQNLNGEQVITQGVKEGDKVVTRGQLALYPGARYQLAQETPKEPSPDQTTEKRTA